VCDRSDQAAHYHNLGPQLGASLLTRHIGWKQKKKERKKESCLPRTGIVYSIASMPVYAPSSLESEGNFEQYVTENLA
jgi:hypothetical protein